MMQGREIIFLILKYAAFLLCCAWLIFFVFITSSREYHWMMAHVDIDLPHGSPWQNLVHPVRSGFLYIIFLFHFGLACLVFLRKWNVTFAIGLGAVFCYATYAFVGI